MATCTRAHMHVVQRVLQARADERARTIHSADKGPCVNVRNKATPVRASDDRPICALARCSRPCHEHVNGRFAPTCSRKHHDLRQQRQQQRSQDVRGEVRLEQNSPHHIEHARPAHVSADGMRECPCDEDEAYVPADTRTRAHKARSHRQTRSDKIMPKAKRGRGTEGAGKQRKPKVYLFMNNIIPMKRSGPKSASSMLQRLVDDVEEVGHFVAVSVGGCVVTFRHDTGTSISQISSTHVRNLQRHGAMLKLMEEREITWCTPARSTVIRARLWLVPNVAILDLRNEGSTIPNHVLMLENPELETLDAFLGRSTLMRLNLSTAHATGELVSIYGLRIKMWKAARHIAERLAELYPERKNMGIVPSSSHQQPAEPTSADNSSEEEASAGAANVLPCPNKPMMMSPAESSESSVDIENMSITDTGMEPCSVTPPSRKQWKRLRRATVAVRDSREAEDQLQLRIAMATLSRVTVDENDVVPTSAEHTPPASLGPREVMRGGDTPRSVASSNSHGPALPRPTTHAEARRQSPISPSVAAIFDSSDDSDGGGMPGPSLIMATAPLKSSEVPTTWPALPKDSQNAGWRSRREVMRERRQVARRRKAERHARSSAGPDRPVSPPARQTNRMEVDEDVVVATPVDGSHTVNGQQVGHDERGVDKDTPAKRHDGC